MVKVDPTRIIFCDGGMFTRDLDKNFDAVTITLRSWHTGEREIAPYMPTTEHVSVARFCVKILRLRQQTVSLPVRHYLN